MTNFRTKDGHIKESAIKDAQAVIEAVMTECDFDGIGFQRFGDVRKWTMLYEYKYIRGESLAELYIHRLHEMAGTTPPPF